MSFLSYLLVLLFLNAAFVWGTRQATLTPFDVLTELAEKAPPQAMMVVDRVTGTGTPVQLASSACARIQGNSWHLCSVEEVLASWIVNGEYLGWEMRNDYSHITQAKLFATAWTSTRGPDTSVNGDDSPPIYPTHYVFQAGVSVTVNPAFVSFFDTETDPFPLCCTLLADFRGGTGQTGSSTGSGPVYPVVPPIIQDFPGVGEPPTYKEHCVLSPVSWSRLTNTYLFDPRQSSIASVPLTQAGAQQAATSDPSQLGDGSLPNPPNPVPPTSWQSNPLYTTHDWLFAWENLQDSLKSPTQSIAVSGSSGAAKSSLLDTFTLKSADFDYCAMSPPEHGSLGSCPLMLPDQESCDFVCDAGYELSGASMECGSNGLIVGFPQTCSPPIFVVTAATSGSMHFIIETQDGPNPNITLATGVTYQFQIQLTGTHDFVFTTQPFTQSNIGSDGACTALAASVNGGLVNYYNSHTDDFSADLSAPVTTLTFTFTPQPQEAGNVLYYTCATHCFSGTISIVAPESSANSDTMVFYDPFVGGLSDMWVATQGTYSTAKSGQLCGVAPSESPTIPAIIQLDAIFTGSIHVAFDFQLGQRKSGVPYFNILLAITGYNDLANPVIGQTQFPIGCIEGPTFNGCNLVPSATNVTLIPLLHLGDEYKMEIDIVLYDGLGPRAISTVVNITAVPNVQIAQHVRMLSAQELTFFQSQQYVLSLEYIYPDGSPVRQTCVDNFFVICRASEGCHRNCFPGFAPHDPVSNVDVNHICLKCAAGSFSDGVNSCMTCPPGSYTDQIGESSCSPCDPLIAPYSGTSSCPSTNDLFSSYPWGGGGGSAVSQLSMSGDGNFMFFMFPTHHCDIMESFMHFDIDLPFPVDFTFPNQQPVTFENTEQWDLTSFALSVDVYANSTLPSGIFSKSRCEDGGDGFIWEMTDQTMYFYTHTNGWQAHPTPVPLNQWSSWAVIVQNNLIQMCRTDVPLCDCDTFQGTVTPDKTRPLRLGVRDTCNQFKGSLRNAKVVILADTVAANGVDVVRANTNANTLLQQEQQALSDEERRTTVFDRDWFLRSVIFANAPPSQPLRTVYADLTNPRFAVKQQSTVHTQTHVPYLRNVDVRGWGWGSSASASRKGAFATSSPTVNANAEAEMLFMTTAHSYLETEAETKTQTETEMRVLPSAFGIAIGLTHLPDAVAGGGPNFDSASIDYGFLIRKGFVSVIDNGQISATPLQAPYAFRSAEHSYMFRLERTALVVKYYVTAITSDNEELIYTSTHPAKVCRYWSAVSFESNIPINGTATELNPVLGAHFYKNKCPAPNAYELGCDNTYMNTDDLYWNTDFCSTRLVNCAHDCNSTAIYGTGRYTGNSGICEAAIHSANIHGGDLVINPMSGFDNFPVTQRNGITSALWLGGFPVTFKVYSTVGSWDTTGYCGEVEAPLNAIPNRTCSWMGNYRVCSFGCRVGYQAPTLPTNSLGMVCMNGQWYGPAPACNIIDPSGYVGCFSRFAGDDSPGSGGTEGGSPLGNVGNIDVVSAGFRENKHAHRRDNLRARQSRHAMHLNRLKAHFLPHTSFSSATSFDIRSHIRDNARARFQQWQHERHHHHHHHPNVATHPDNLNNNYLNNDNVAFLQETDLDTDADADAQTPGNPDAWGNYPAINDMTFISMGHSIASCWLQAKMYNTSHFGLTDGSACYVGNVYEQFGPANDCHQPCDAFPNQICGSGQTGENGGNSWSIYDTSIYTPPPFPPLPQYVGCFQLPDSESSQNFYKIAQYQTIWSCWQLALQTPGQPTYFGLANGGDCYIGTQYKSADSPLGMVCDTPCTADPYHTCGGGIDPGNVDVYETYFFTSIMDIGMNTEFKYDAILGSDQQSIWTVPGTYDNDGNKKYQAFNTTAFQVMRVCVQYRENCMIYPHNKVFESAVELFNSGFIPFNTTLAQEFLQLWPTRNCGNLNMINAGFNVECQAGNDRFYNTRMGFCSQNVPCPSLIETSSTKFRSKPHTSSPSPSSSRHLLAHAHTNTDATTRTRTRSQSRSHSRTQQRLSAKLHGLSLNAHVLTPQDQVYEQRENEFDKEAELAQWQDEKIKLKALANKATKIAQDALTFDAPIVGSVIGLGLDSSDGDSWGAGWSTTYDGPQRTGDEGSLLHGVPAWLDVAPAANWTLIMTLGQDALFYYDSAHWTTNTVYPSNQNGKIADTNGNAKFDEFNTVPFSQIRMCIGAPMTNCITTTLSTVYDNALELFNAGYVHEGVNTNDFYSVFQPWQQPPCPPLYFGFNVQCPSSGNSVRWGFCGSMPLPSSSLDCSAPTPNLGVIGLGLRAVTDCCQAGAGYTNNFVYNKPNPILGQGFQQQGQYTGHESAEFAWLYVRPLTGLTQKS